MAEVLTRRFCSKTLCWVLKNTNIVDEPADVLICSANVSLNLSGGVGADLLARYGVTMQQRLHQMIAFRSPRAAFPGEVFSYISPEVPYKAVLHAVAVDGWYHSTSSVVQRTVCLALEMAASMGAQTVTLTALATGFGDLSLGGFAEGVRPLLDGNFHPITEVCICVLEDYRLLELAEHLFHAPTSV